MKIIQVVLGLAAAQERILKATSFVDGESARYPGSLRGLESGGGTVFATVQTPAGIVYKDILSKRQYRERDSKRASRAGLYFVSRTQAYTFNFISKKVMKIQLGNGRASISGLLRNPTQGASISDLATDYRGNLLIASPHGPQDPRGMSSIWVHNLKSRKRSRIPIKGRLRRISYSRATSSIIALVSRSVKGKSFTLLLSIKRNRPALLARHAAPLAYFDPTILRVSPSGLIFTLWKPNGKVEVFSKSGVFRYAILTNFPPKEVAFGPRSRVYFSGDCTENRATGTSSCIDSLALRAD